MIEEHSDYFLSNNCDSNEQHLLFYSQFVPSDKNSIKATVLIVHGMQEHCERYADFARFLTHNGIAVLTYDHIGHGKTAQGSADFGYFGKNGRKQVVADAQNMADFLEKQFPTVPHFIFGHSMGSFITRCLLQIAHHQFEGAVICGTGGKIPGIQLAKVLTATLNFVAPKSKSTFIEKVFGNMNNARFKAESNQNNTNWLSVETENRKAFLADELCGIPFTNNGFDTLIALNRDATKRNWARTIRKNLPLLFISGEDDPIGNFGNGVRQTVANLKTDGFESVTMQLYPKKRHEILNEANKQEVYTTVLQWLDKIKD
jgi:alpha-beta hydrolase superfamily lysophospholipase